MNKPEICPFTHRCGECRRPVENAQCKCECGEEFDFFHDNAPSDARIMMEEVVHEETTELEQRLLYVERWITCMSVFLGFYFLMKTAEIVIDWIR